MTGDSERAGWYRDHFLFATMNLPVLCFVDEIELP
jgi:hypothetical protein